MRSLQAEIGLKSKWYHSQTQTKVQVKSHLGNIVHSFCDLIWCDDLATSSAHAASSRQLDMDNGDEYLRLERDPAVCCRDDIAIGVVFMTVITEGAKGHTDKPEPRFRSLLNG